MSSAQASRPQAVNVSLYTIRHTQIGGTEFGIYNWIKGLSQTDARVSVTYGRDEDLSPSFVSWLAEHPEIRATKQDGFGGPKSLRFLQETLMGVRGSDDDWLVFPNYFCPPKWPSAKRRYAVILHDIQYKIFPQYHSAKRRAWLDAYLPRMFQMADRVLLISHSEAALVREHFGPQAASKCTVVQNAVDWSRLEPANGPASDPVPPEVEERLRRRYILSVCHLFPHKNVITLLRAFVGAATDDPELHLYLVGSLSESNKTFIRSAIPDELIDRVEILGFVDDRILGAYFRHASLFALPSLYEGFGMPAVEAMGFGTPTLVSRCFGLPEGTLDEALYVDDPLDVQEWRTRIVAALASGQRLPQSTVDRVRTFYAPRTIALSLLNALGPQR